jgi:hypothetical protein
MFALGKAHARRGIMGVALMTLGLIANQSLTGLLAFAVVAAVMGIPLVAQARFTTLLSLALAVAVMIVVSVKSFPAVFQDIAGRLARLSVANSSGRFDALPMVWRTFRERPWGTGLSGIPLGQDVHNGVLLLVLQFGIIGLLLPLLWIVAIAVGGLIVVVERRRLEAGERSALMASTGFLAVQLASWFSSGEMRHTIVWILSGAAFATLGRAIEQLLRGRPRAGEGVTSFPCSETTGMRRRRRKTADSMAR